MSRGRSALLSVVGVGLLVAGLLCAGFGYWFVGLVKEERALAEGARQHIEAARHSGDKEELLRSLVELADHSGDKEEAVALVEAAGVALELGRGSEGLEHMRKAMTANPNAEVQAHQISALPGGEALRNEWIRTRVGEIDGLRMLEPSSLELVWDRSRNTSIQLTLDRIKPLLREETLRVWVIESGDGSVGGTPATYWLLTLQLTSTSDGVLEVAPSDTEAVRAKLRASALCWWWHASSTRDGYDELLLAAIAEAEPDHLVDLTRNEGVFHVRHDNGVTEGELVPGASASVLSEVLQAMHTRLQPGTVEGVIKSERLDLQLYRELGYELERRASR